MRETIKAEMERKISSTQLLNSNALLVISQEENEEYPLVSVRYVDKDSIRETPIARLNPITTVRHNDKMIAVFTEGGKFLKKPHLTTVFDLECHEFVGNDFLRMVYDMKKERGAMVKQLTNKQK